ncbi:MAG TPA: hypothetical protein GXZ36_09780 [Firmicutes bacterium]|nr:hypothetical protein [Bacillota bacterium]
MSERIYYFVVKLVNIPCGAMTPRALQIVTEGIGRALQNSMTIWKKRFLEQKKPAVAKELLIPVGNG